MREVEVVPEDEVAQDEVEVAQDEVEVEVEAEVVRIAVSKKTRLRMWMMTCLVTGRAPCPFHCDRWILLQNEGGRAARSCPVRSVLSVLSFFFH